MKTLLVCLAYLPGSRAPSIRLGHCSPTARARYASKPIAPCAVHALCHRYSTGPWMDNRDWNAAAGPVADGYPR